MVKVLKKRTELLTVGVVKENNMGASLSTYVFHPILVTFTSIFLLEMMLKTVIMSAKNRELWVILWWGAREHFTTSKDKSIDENQPGPSRRHSEWLSHLEKPTVEPPVVACSNFEGYKFIYSNVLNELISNTLCCQCKSNSLNSERCCEKRTWWTFSCLFDVYLFRRLVDECLTDAVVDKIQNYYGVAIQSNIVKLKETQNVSGQYIFTWSWRPSNETLNERHEYCPVTPSSR